MKKQELVFELTQTIVRLNEIQNVMTMARREGRMDVADTCIEEFEELQLKAQTLLVEHNNAE